MKKLTNENYLKLLDAMDHMALAAKGASLTLKQCELGTKLFSEMLKKLRDEEITTKEIGTGSVTGE